MTQNINIGLVGFGTVGEGLYRVMENQAPKGTKIKKICIKNEKKERSIPKDNFSTSYDTILDDPDINLVVELIDDADAAYDIVKQALISGKSVVSGNKKMLASNLYELIHLQKETNTSLLYDASACGSIPIIRNLEEYYDNDLFKSVTGILNGSSNFILTKMFRDGQDYQDALKTAQNLGFAESDPSFDVDGLDALYKLVIITVHSLGAIVSPDSIFYTGISSISKFDVEFAKARNQKIKLVACVERLDKENFNLFVIPKLVGKDEFIYNVEDEYNGLVIEGEYYDKQFMFGKGAGAFPTGSAVLSDITARLHNYKYEYKKRNFYQVPKLTNERELSIYLKYTNDSDLKLFNFKQIEESYNGVNGKYVCGKIDLSDLIKLGLEIKERGIFIALLK